MNAVLITGAAGFLGSHLAEHFLNQGFAVIGLDNFCTGSRENVALLKSQSANFLFLESDVCAPWSDAEQLLTNRKLQLKYVFHFASPASPEHYVRLALETIRVNTLGLQLALEFADRHQARTLFASTSEVYGDPEVSPQPESYWGCVNSFGERSCYDEAKRCGEAIIFSHNKRFKTQHGLVRIFNTYGPRMNPNDGRVVINFILQALKNSDLTIYGTGEQTRSFCYVSDLISGIAKYAASGICTPINLGMDQEFTVLQLAEVVKKATGSKSVLKFLPLPSDDPRRRRPDLTLAKKNLDGWQPGITLQEGVQKMTDWLRTQIR